MCYESCFMLYEVGMNLKDLTCPCGCGYWNCFEKAFVTGDQIRHGRGARPSRAAHEAEVKAKLSPEEYQARLREQFIEHFLKCEGQGQTTANTVRGASIVRRARAELNEIKNGDFISQGRSTLQNTISGTTRPTDDDHPLGLERHAAVSSLPSPSSVRHRDGGARGTTASRDEAREYLKQQLASQQRKVTPEQLEILVSQYLARLKSEGGPTTESTAPVIKRRTTLVTQFLPSEDIELPTLKQWLNNNMGPSATARPYIHQKDGKSREGFLVEADRALDRDMITQIKKESKLAGYGGRARTSAIVPETSMFPPRHARHTLPASTERSYDLGPLMAQVQLDSSPSITRDRRRGNDDDDSESSDSDRRDPKQSQRPREYRHSNETRVIGHSRQDGSTASSISQSSTNTSSQRKTSSTLSSVTSPSSRHTTIDLHQPAQRHTTESRPRRLRAAHNETDSEGEEDDQLDTRPATTSRDSRLEPARRDSRPESGRQASSRDRPKERGYRR